MDAVSPHSTLFGSTMAALVIGPSVFAHLLQLRILECIFCGCDVTRDLDVLVCLVFACKDSRDEDDHLERSNERL